MSMYVYGQWPHNICFIEGTLLFLRIQEIENVTNFGFVTEKIRTKNEIANRQV